MQAISSEISSEIKPLDGRRTLFFQPKKLELIPRSSGMKDEGGWVTVHGGYFYTIFAYRFSNQNLPGTPSQSMLGV